MEEQNSFNWYFYFLIFFCGGCFKDKGYIWKDWEMSENGVRGVKFSKNHKKVTFKTYVVFEQRCNLSDMLFPYSFVSYHIPTCKYIWCLSMFLKFHQRSILIKLPFPRFKLSPVLKCKD